ncbi:hypothetical protein J2739_004662 [Variovorax soli]|uniref:Uncharacterized protein n=1 Tax=Variovorax soli TaxID=376815 RepID=A0ABU1NK80_9BURK|nr:hypothetical protein [Variovorax soli]
MPLYFARLKTGHPERLAPPRDGPGSFKIYTILENHHQWSCKARADVAALSSAEDQNRARACLVQFQLNAAHGLPLPNMYDGTALHATATFTWRHHEYKIWRIRQSTIRTCFIYLNGKRIVILKILAKRRGELSEGEKKNLSDSAIEILEQLACRSFESTELEFHPVPISV